MDDVTEAADGARHREEAEGLQPGTRVGPFTVLRLLGRGGMGQVYLAEQDRPSRRVALKLLWAELSSPKLQRRFELEGELLARLDHPGIARVWQVGTFEGALGTLPWIAMEWVEGRPIDEYVREAQLDLRGRLALVAAVADAVQHAHERGVLHRDLKPANILVDGQGQPRVLDFGIARSLDDAGLAATRNTEFGQVVGTLPYMSPEQVLGDQRQVDTRSDVWALGVLLYELLCGRRPHALEHLPVAEIARTIVEDDARPVSVHDRRLRGDVETIVATALERDPRRRYASAHALADDLRRFLGDQPITARPASTFYQLSKFARRNRGLMVGACAVLLTLVAGLVSTGLALRRALASEVRAREGLEVAERTAEVTRSFLGAVDPEQAAGRDTELLRDLLGEAGARIEAELGGLPEVQAALLEEIGRTFADIAEPAAAQAHLERALHFSTLSRGADARQSLGIELALAQSRRSLGDLEGAEQALRALSPRTAALGAEARDLAVQNQRLLADVLVDRGEYGEAEELLAGAAADLERVEDPEVRASVHVARGSLLRRTGRHGEAAGEFEAARAIFVELGEAGWIGLGGVLNSLAVLAREGQDNARAQELYRESLATRRKLYDRPHPDVAVTLLNLGWSLTSSGAYAEALPLLEESVQMHRELYPQDHPGLAIALDRWGMTQHIAGDAERGAELLQESAAMMERVLGPSHPNLVTSWTNLAAVALDRGQVEQAEHWARRAVELVEARPDHLPHLLAPSLAALGSALLLQGRYGDCVSTLERARGEFARYLGEDTRPPQGLRRDLALALLRLGRTEEARAELAALIALAEADPTSGPAERAHLRACAVLAQWQAQRELGSELAFSVDDELEATLAALENSPVVRFGELARELRALASSER
jgi:tetratricopeptide (TPR) repeat protein